MRGDATIELEGATTTVAAEVIVRLGDTVLQVHDLRPATDTGLLSQTLRLSGLGLVGISLIIGLLTPAIGPSLICALTGTTLLAAGITTKPAPCDRFLLGEAPTVDLPLNVQPVPGDPQTGATELVRVIDGAVVLRLPPDLDGTIRTIAPDGEAEVLTIESLRARGWRSYRLALGDRAIFRRDTLTIEVGAIVPPPAVAINSSLSARDRGAWLAHTGSLGVLGVLGVLFVLAATREIDLSSPLTEETVDQRMLRAITALPVPLREEAEPLREGAPKPRADATQTSSRRKVREPSAPPNPAETVEVEVDGELVAAPTIARAIGRKQTRKGGKKRLEDFADGDAGSAILGQMIENQVIVERESMTHYVDTKDDFDAWAALTQGPPVRRGVGGLDLIGTGRTGGGRAEEINTSARNPGKAHAIQLASQAKARPRGKLRVGAPRSTGALDRGHLSEVARSGRTDLRHCWVDAERRGSSGGAVKLVVEIGDDGRVRDAKVLGELDDPKLAPCLRAVAKGWRYDKPISDGGTVTYPLDYDIG